MVQKTIVKTNIKFMICFFNAIPLQLRTEGWGLICAKAGIKIKFKSLRNCRKIWKERNLFRINCRNKINYGRRGYLNACPL